MNTEPPPGTSGYTGKDILYREGVVGFLDVQRAADALLRQGRKPSVAGIREQLGGGSPNTITPLLAKYWQKLGERLGEGPESLERVPEALARVTELLWRRALEEARERLKLLRQPDHKPEAVEQLQEQIGKLSVALAESRAREGEQVAQLGSLSRDRQVLQGEVRRLISIVKSGQLLLGRRDNQRDPLGKDLHQQLLSRQRKSAPEKKPLTKRTPRKSTTPIKSKIRRGSARRGHRSRIR